MSSPSRNIHFIYLTDPAKGSAISSHKAAKSHAARHGHARVRRQRMNDYQQERNKHEGSSQASPAPASRSSASVRHANSAKASISNSHENEASREIILYPPHRPQPLVLELSPLSSVNKNVYSVYGTQFNPTEQFLVHHYVGYVIPFGKRHCTHYTDSSVWKRFMLTELFPLALANSGLLNGVLLSACRSLFREDPNNTDYYVQLATYYKLACLRSMSELLAAENQVVGDSAIAQASMLAADELGVGDRKTSRQHIDAAKQMVDMKGGSEKLGLNGFLAALVDTLTCAVARRDPIYCDQPE